MESDSRWHKAVMLLLPLVLLAGFIGNSWRREERARRETISRATKIDTRYRLAPPVTLRDFSATDAWQRRLNLDTLRLTFRATLREEVEASLREAIEKGTFKVSTGERDGTEGATSPGQIPPVPH